jgi:glutamine amidotransferase
MCRLTAYVGPEIPLDRLIFGGDHSLLKQSYAAQELRSGTVNVDGYGIAWFPAANPVRIAEARPVWHDPDLGPVLSSIERPVALAAVRSATPGIPVDRNAVAPILHDRWAFALNGFVWDFRTSAMRSMRRDLPDHLYAALSGVSDTETLFLTAVTALERGASLADGLRYAFEASVAAAATGGVAAQLNLAITDGAGVAFTRGSNGPDPNSLYWSSESSVAPGGTLVASEPLTPDDPWAPVPEGHVFSLRLGEAPVIEPI